MTLLQRHVLRTVRQKALRLLGIALLVGVSMGLYIGNYSAIRGLTTFVLDYYESSRMAQLEIFITTDDQINTADYGGFEGLEAIEERLYLPGAASLSGTKVSMVIIGRPELATNQINTLIAQEGLLDSSSGAGIVLERNCASHYGVGIGDNLAVRVGEDQFDLSVAAIAESPEFIVAPANPTAFVPTSGSLCVLFMDLAWLQERLGFRAVNAILFRFSDRVTSETLREQILEITRNHSMIDLATRDTERFGFLYLEINMATFRNFIPAIVFVFCLSSAFVIIFLGAQWIASERTQIGMLMALGYSPLKVLGGYSLILFVIILLAWIAAIPFSYASLFGFGANFASSIGMPSPDLRLLPENIAIGSLGAALLVILAMLAPLSMILRVRPIDAVRGVQISDNVRLAELLRSLTSDAPSWLRIGTRNAMRRPVVSLVTILSISLCLGITLSFRITLTSVEHTAVAAFDQDEWTATVELSRPIWEEQIENEFTEFAPAEFWEGFLRGPGMVGDAGHEQNIFVTGTRPSSANKLKLLSGRMPEASGVVMENKLVTSLMLELGDEVELRIEGNTYSATLIGVHSGSVPGEVWTELSFAQMLFEREEQYNGIFFLGELPPGGEPLRSAVMGHRDVVNFFTMQQAKEAILSITSQIREIIRIGSAFAIAGAMLFVFTNLSFTILARADEYLMMRVLGFSRRSVTATILAEVMLVCVLGVALAPIVGFLVSNLLNARLSDVWFVVDTYVSLGDVLIGALPALLLVPLAALPTIFKINSSVLSTVTQQARAQ